MGVGLALFDILQFEDVLKTDIVFLGLEQALKADVVAHIVQRLVGFAPVVDLKNDADIGRTGFPILRKRMNVVVLDIVIGIDDIAGDKAAERAIGTNLLPPDGLFLYVRQLSFFSHYSSVIQWSGLAQPNEIHL